MTDEDKLKRYLLGDLPEAETARIEERYFADPGVFDQLVEVENRLVDDHARGQLSGKTLELFESHYLAHQDRRERARFAAALNTRVTPVRVAAEPGASWWDQLLFTFGGPKLTWAFSVLCLVLLAGLIWFFIERRQLRQDLARAEAQRAEQTERQRKLEQELIQEKQWADRLSGELAQAQQSVQPSPAPLAPTGPSVATLIFQISGIRGAEVPSPARLIIPATADRARLQLNLKESDFEIYTVVIHTADGKEIFKQDNLRAHKPSVITVIVPAHRLAPGDYILTLKGRRPQGELEDVSQSLFHVEKK